MLKGLYDIHGGTSSERIKAIRKYVDEFGLKEFNDLGYTNNHIHTIYSFSPYSPAEAVYYSKLAGLSSAGIVDHDTMAGAREFLAAGEILDFATTVGMECRVSMKGTALESYRLNSPDQSGVAYMVLHSVPHQYIEEVTDFFALYRQKRNDRNIKMLAMINEKVGCDLDFERDVIPLSQYEDGGSVTERHLMYALSKWITSRYEKGVKVVNYLENDLGIFLTGKLKERMLDTDNKHYEYDLLGILKSTFIKDIFIPADEELPHIKDMIKFADKIDAVFAYSYLGDVGDSVTGDKAKQTFEDSFLPLLFDTLKELGIKAVTYMPSRNTRQQLKRLQGLCRDYNMMEISGEDINSPRQSFICKQLKEDDFKHLSKTTWYLIEHERQ